MPEVDEREPPRSYVRRYGAKVVAVLAAFGVLGAVGTRLVNHVFTSADDNLHAGKPLLIGVREDPHGGSDGFLLAAKSPTGLDKTLRTAHDCDSLMKVAKHAGAADVNFSITDLLLEGATRRDVTILDMRAKIVKRGPPLAGAEIGCASAGSIDALCVAFNLDEETPIARKIVESIRPGTPYFQGNVVELKKGEQQPFEVLALTNRHYVEWEIEADVRIDNKDRTVTISNHGKPFKITASGKSYGRYYEWLWADQTPHLYIGSTRATG